MFHVHVWSLGASCSSICGLMQLPFSSGCCRHSWTGIANSDSTHRGRVAMLFRRQHTYWSNRQLFHGRYAISLNVCSRRAPFGGGEYVWLFDETYTEHDHEPPHTHNESLENVWGPSLNTAAGDLYAVWLRCQRLVQFTSHSLTAASLRTGRAWCASLMPNPRLTRTRSSWSGHHAKESPKLDRHTWPEAAPTRDLFAEVRS